MFDKTRNDERVNIVTKCSLDINGAKYDCIVDNISTIGASIEMNGLDQSTLHIGDVGTLHVLLISVVEYLCKVVRIDSKGVGLQFVEH
ncbi:MAG: PilZ domain-containing protein [Pelobacteraceae bacterium]